MSLKTTGIYRSLDWVTLSLYLCLVLVGWLMIFTVGYEDMNDGGIAYFLGTPIGRQTIWISISFLAIFLLFFIDWKFWQTFSSLIYIFSMALLLLVIFLGTKTKGATSWFMFGGFSFQPSELAKFATCLVLSSYLSSFSTTMRKIEHQAIAIGFFSLPMALILLQPDAGSALVFLSFLIVLYRAGLSEKIYILSAFVIALFILALKYPALNNILGLTLLTVFILALGLKKKQYSILTALGIIVIAIYLVINGLAIYGLSIALLAFSGYSLIAWNNRKQRLIMILSTSLIAGSALIFTANYAFNNILGKHQQDRINVWLNPEKCDPRGSLYNIRQSKMAIGSGGFQGKGFLKGVMTKLDYVPEQSTDFIFCTVGEEQGFLGSMSIMALFLLLLFRLISIAERQRSIFSRFYCYGIAGIIFVHFFINIGMTMGVVPIIGIPLPFISRGGSSLLIFSIMIGVVLKLDSNRFRI